MELFVLLANSDVAMGVIPLQGDRDALDDQLHCCKKEVTNN